MTTYNNKLESEVRFYSRLFPDIFTKGKGAYLYSDSGEKYLDFFCGSGSLNYGHNEPVMKEKVIEYITNNGVLNSLDQLTRAKVDFMNDFNNNILIPRNMEYKMQFCGPTGTNSVEAALKLARKYTQREKILFFKDSFHGMTYGAMSVSGIKSSNISNDYTKNVTGIPYEDVDPNFDTLKELLKNATKEEIPAAIILETIQAEGGMKTASKEWLEQLQLLAKEHAILLIIDDIQAGCGRTGSFFSFEHTNISPDIICLSKSLSGIGVPFSMNLIKPAIDCWKPGEHNGTFRGNNLAFIAGGEATKYWKTSAFGDTIT
ncbi:diaminobutyrate--2-oxoglutarate transaminase, partial [Flavobacteriaceae bacterium]|nr:diaminobutyrate--2-oxoglutarate transaminase [Flavobacteriaceae bacterium]